MINADVTISVQYVLVMLLTRAYEVDEDLRITLEVFYLYIELDPIGPMIDGSLVLSGTAISDKQAPAFCTIEYAANNHDYKDIGLVAPWAFMLSSGAQKPLHFTIPISLPDEYKEVLVGMIRLIVYMDDVNVIPFDNESTKYDMVSAEETTAHQGYYKGGQSECLPGYRFHGHS